MTRISRTFSSGIDLENIVYYKDDTHYFVMTAKKQSLLEKGVILHVSDQGNVSYSLSDADKDQRLSTEEKTGVCISFCFPNGLTKPTIFRNRLMTQAFASSR